MKYDLSSHYCFRVPKCLCAPRLFQHALCDVGVELFPGYDNRSWTSTSLLGFLSRRQWKQEASLLLDVQHLQARALSSLFSLQSMRVKHGPSLSVDQQLCRILEPQIFHALTDLCACDDIFCGGLTFLWLASECLLGTWRLLLFEAQVWLRDACSQPYDLDCLHAQCNNLHTHDYVPQIPHQPCTDK